MKYSDIILAIGNLDTILHQRDELIRDTAQQLLFRLQTEEFGFPKSDICLQAIDSPLDDPRSYHVRELPTDDKDKRRGFRIRFLKHHSGYLLGVMCLAKWVFSVDGDELVAQISGGSESFRTALGGSPSATFVNELAIATVAQIASGIQQMSQDPSVQRTMGFHSLKES